MLLSVAISSAIWFLYLKFELQSRLDKIQALFCLWNWNSRQVFMLLWEGLAYINLFQCPKIKYFCRQAIACRFLLAEQIIKAVESWEKQTLLQISKMFESVSLNFSFGKPFSQVMICYCISKPELSCCAKTEEKIVVWSQRWIRLSKFKRKMLVWIQISYHYVGRMLVS